MVEPGDFSGPELGCCSPWVGAYILGTSLSGDAEDYRSNVGADLRLNGPVFGYGNPNGFAGSGFSNYKVRGDKGYMTKYLNGPEDCITVNAYTQADNISTISNSIGISEAVILSEELIEDKASISIYNISGQRVFYSKIDYEHYNTNSALKKLYN